MLAAALVAYNMPFARAIFLPAYTGEVSTPNVFRFTVDGEKAESGEMPKKVARKQKMRCC
jgi:hypothetical protein